MSPSRIRRIATALVVAASSAGAMTAASAAAGFHGQGLLSAVNTAQHTLTVRDNGGDPALRGHTVTVRLLSSTRIERDGARVAVQSLRSGDRIDVTGHRDARRRLIASTVDATSPPRPDGPAVTAPVECAYYQCTPGLPPATGSGTVTITISNYTFNPPALVIPAGTIVTVRNIDPVAHTFSGNHLDSGALSSGDAFTVEFTNPGSYRFFCAYHPFMNGVIDVEQ